MSSELLGNVTAVVLAGGLGTRVQHLLNGAPKPLAPVAGRPFVDWLLLYLRRNGLSRVVLSTGYKAESIRAHLAEVTIPGLATRCVSEREPLGTAGGFLNAVAGARWASEWWLVLNGDTLVLTDLTRFVQEVRDSGDDAGLLSVFLQDTARFGRVNIDDQGHLAGFTEKATAEPGFVNAGLYLIKNRALERFPRRLPLSFEHDVFPSWLAKGTVRVRVVKCEAPFLDIGTPETLMVAGQFVYEHRQWFEQ
ncbi:MAG: sugar phosphate nucleotidyltransferase [Verrucomicrobiae bacterium]|nr:sugar phosphate nucleotidyltransferase [Verrucomicrobiae bacterium]